MTLYLKAAGVLVFASVAAAGTSGAMAQDTGTAQSGIVFDLGAAGKVTPRYAGSSELILSPVPLIRVKRLTLPNGLTFGGGSDEGLSFGPAFNVVGERSAKHAPELAGLNTIDAAVELGVAARYQVGQFRLMGEVRRGFGGHEGFRGEIGADLIVTPHEQWTFHGGPRLAFADSTYTNTYFGVSPAEASARFPATRASGGLIGAGLEAGMRYQINDAWALEGSAGWTRLTGDAARSPITAQGSKDQFTFSLGVLRRFQIDF
ncbi:MipA/OmpV family protein [Hoeflea olei]|uniref:MltA-interacting MipA family protein n=1 Tax=Hoeflea olei TaxID=1480615 RepID=A0A1C1YTQ9_9HYPH|nr:MipA/OmpV family protein [Hoeflea olei]OCW56911.1 hypothetical protein AWJ14_07055 [Hoeflea olei]